MLTALEFKMNKYIVEFIGTFFLVFTIGSVVIGGTDNVTPPLAIAGVLMAMIYAGGHISGAHYNPAVTIALLLRGKCDGKDALPYIIAQVAAGAVAAISVIGLKGSEVTVSAMDLSTKVPQVIAAEALFTFALAFVILNVATAKGTEGNSFYGFAIGLVVLVGAYAVGDLSGAVFNPAVAVGISMMGISAWSQIWIFIVANVAGAIVAAIVFKVVNGWD